MPTIPRHTTEKKTYLVNFFAVCHRAINIFYIRSHQVTNIKPNGTPGFNCTEAKLNEKIIIKLQNSQNSRCIL